MKKLAITITLLTSIFYTNAQNSSTSKLLEERQHEVRLNGLYLILGAFEGSYSYVLNDESTVGVSIFLPIDDDVSDDINYYISPYYRFFFGKKPTAGFFLEGFGMLNSVNEELFFGFDVATEEETIVDFALGIGLGAKFMTKRGIIGEINAGLGRNLFNDKSDEIGTEIVSKIGVSIGYRF